MDFVDWVSHWLKELRLTHFYVTVQTGESNEWNAKCITTDGTRRATITYTEDMDRDVREVALHEVIHILLSDMAAADGKTNSDLENEKVTDHLTFVILGMNPEGEQ